MIQHPDADAKRVVDLRLIKGIKLGEKAGKACIVLEFTAKLQKTGEKVGSLSAPAIVDGRCSCPPPGHASAFFSSRAAWSAGISEGRSSALHEVIIVVGGKWQQPALALQSLLCPHMSQVQNHVKTLISRRSQANNTATKLSTSSEFGVEGPHTVCDLHKPAASRAHGRLACVRDASDRLPRSILSHSATATCAPIPKRNRVHARARRSAVTTTTCEMAKIY